MYFWLYGIAYWMPIQQKLTPPMLLLVILPAGIKMLTRLDLIHHTTLLGRYRDVKTLNRRHFNVVIVFCLIESHRLIIIVINFFISVFLVRHHTRTTRRDGLPRWDFSLQEDITRILGWVIKANVQVVLALLLFCVDHSWWKYLSSIEILCILGKYQLGLFLKDSIHFREDCNRQNCRKKAMWRSVFFIIQHCILNADSTKIHYSKVT